jgi:hypothetical protein
MAPAQVHAADSSDASGRSRRSQWGALEYVVSFVFYMLFFGLIAAFLRSRFPIDLGLFLFFTNDELMEWALRKVGIRLVPESLGATFISAFVWVTGASILLVRWSASAPAWLSSIVPPNPPPWHFISGAALGCALLAAISTAVVGKLLPWAGIKIAPGSVPWKITGGLVGFGILGLVFLLGFAMAPGLTGRRLRIPGTTCPADEVIE